eukprot:GILK01006418.1.p1 GENE.GILK01006418.1~~GILK01006418.1.p1  ORF type:complete len:425 (+),score=53.62 GILK01006418.1:45-1319(+)
MSISGFLSALHLSKYNEVFTRNGFEDMESLCELTDLHLQQLHIEDADDRAALLAAIKLVEKPIEHMPADNTLPSRSESSRSTSLQGPPASGSTPLTLELLRSTAGVHSTGKSDSDAALLARVTHLRFNGKRLSQIDHLDMCPAVRVLYLYENRIERLRGLSNCQQLTHLYLQNNRISVMEGLSSLVNLTKLYLNDNCITCLEGLDRCTRLEELHLSNQRLPPGQPMLFSEDSLYAVSRSLRVLNVANVHLEDPTPLAILERLQSLNLSKNLIDRYDLLAHMLMGMEELQTLDLRLNPITRELKYREKLIMMSTAVDLLDDKKVTTQERSFLFSLEAQKRERKQSKRVQSASMSATSMDQQVDSTHRHTAPSSVMNQAGRAVQMPLPHKPPLLRRGSSKQSDQQTSSEADSSKPGLSVTGSSFRL